MNGIWKKTLKRFVYDFKDLPRMRRLQKSTGLWLRWQMTLTLVWMRLTLGNLLKMIPEELTNEELKLEQERIAEEEARIKETAGEEKEEPPRKLTVKGLAEAFADLNKLLKKFENMGANTERFSLIERDIHGALSAYKQIYDEINQTNHHGHISIKRDISRRASGRSFRQFPEGIVITGDDSSMCVTALEDLPLGQDVEVEVNDVNDTDPVLA